jgi:hypothetical protein
MINCIRIKSPQHQLGQPIMTTMNSDTIWKRARRLDMKNGAVHQSIWPVLMLCLRVRWWRLYSRNSFLFSGGGDYIPAVLSFFSEKKT